ncbi:Fc.00g027110.m01.CDS01 [Cosmosporella sp. VM-42]
MNPPARTRNKPLRTYGKRSASTPDPRGDGSLKRQRTGTEEPEFQSPKPKAQQINATPLMKITTTEQQDGAALVATPAKSAFQKGSIMNYFKPIPTPASTSSSSPASDEVQPASSPASSPPPVQPKARRKPRILRFRGASLPIVDREESGDEGGNGTNTEMRDKEQDQTGDEEEQDDSQGEEDASRPPLRDRKEAPPNKITLNDKAKKQSRPKSTPTVQTTLNISAQAAFSECKVCNTVWNPLHPDDVKFHTKQHASFLRAKRKKEEDRL